MTCYYIFKHKYRFNHHCVNLVSQPVASLMFFLHMFLTGASSLDKSYHVLLGHLVPLSCSSDLHCLLAYSD